MIKAVFIDAIKTIFAPYPTEVGLYKKVILELTGKDMSEEEIQPILDKAMAETEQLDAVKDNSFQQWEHYPTRIAELVGCEGSACKEIGERIRYETWGNPNNYRLYDDVLPTLGALAKRNLYVACVSNEDGWLEGFFKHFGIDKYFQFILTSSELGIEKPNPKIFLEATNRSGFEASEILFVGDSVVSDYRGSEAVGMQPLLIDRESKNTDNSVTAIDDLTQLMEYL